MTLFYSLSATGVLLEGLLLWRLSKNRLLKIYPYFTAFVLFDFIRTFLVVILARFDWNSFAPTYWVADTIAVFLVFAIIWEAVRSVFLPNSVLLHLAKSSLLAVALLASPPMIWLSLSQTSLVPYPYRYVPPVFEQYLTFVQALLLLTIAAVARYYRLRIGRNMRGLIIGSGLYLSLYAANFAGLQAAREFFRYWQLLSPALYIGLLAVWLWAFWQYAPAHQRMNTGFEQAVLKNHWERLWRTTMGAVWKVFN